MCGLVALLSPALPIREDLLVAMRDRLKHRGPDNAGYWVDDSRRVALAHRRLAVIDTTHAADQPMAGHEGENRLVFNGEIYNYIELRADLEREGVAFRTRSDTEVLMAALQAWGQRAIPRLNGMFAFAYWDAVSRTLLVVRDRFGEKPLFVGRGRLGTVVIASEMKAILAHPLVSESVNERALSDYAASAWYEDGTSTFFSSIERVPPAHAVVFDANGLELKRWRFWIPDFTAIDDHLPVRNAVEHFAELLHKSIRMRLRADVPIGSSLSGGLDSSAIVGCLAKERKQGSFSQRTFSACFPDDPTVSEHREVDVVARYTGVEPYIVVPDPVRLADESLRLHWHQEEPFLSASIYLQWCVARLAAESNTTVLLDGQGADELLAGYQFYFRQYQLDLLDRGNVSGAMRETRKFNRRLRLASSRYESASRRFNAEVAYSEAELSKLAEDLPAVTHYPYEIGVCPVRPGCRLRRTLSEAIQYNSLPMLLRYADRNAMAFSRETRLPFLDYDLVDFCIKLPDSYLVRNGWQKWILRQACGDAIPAQIRWRSDKVGYAAPMDTWLRGPLKEWARERLGDSSVFACPGFDQNDINRLWSEHQASRANHSWALWRWISLAEWFSLARSGWWRAGVAA